MIYDSVIWKEELKKDLEDIISFIETTDLNLDQEFEDGERDEERHILGSVTHRFDKFAIYSSIVIRKLIESNKISDELLAKNYSIYKYLRNEDSVMNHRNFFEFRNHYNIEKAENHGLSIKELTHQIIHSFHLFPEYKYKKIDKNLEDDDIDNYEVESFEGIYLASDKTKETKLYYIPLNVLFNIINDVLTDRIVHIEYKNGALVKNSSKN